VSGKIFALSLDGAGTRSKQRPVERPARRPKLRY